MTLPKVGDRIVVGRDREYAPSYVKDVVWVSKEAQWKIILDWGQWGESHVYACDENKVWYRYVNVN